MICVYIYICRMIGNEHTRSVENASCDALSFRALEHSTGLGALFQSVCLHLLAGAVFHAHPLVEPASEVHKTLR